MKFISQMKAVYRNYGQGTKGALIVFAASVVVSVFAWPLVAVRLVSGGTDTTVTLLIAMLATGMAVIMSLFILNTFHDNYRARRAF
jgi:hypothetical protein